MTSRLQPIIHNGHVAAAVIDQHAIILTGLSPVEQRHVQAMCHYAMRIEAGEVPGPYSDQEAEAYAELVATD
jgi:hypothetical protein